MFSYESLVSYTQTILNVDYVLSDTGAGMVMGAFARCENEDVIEFREKEIDLMVFHHRENKTRTERQISGWLDDLVVYAFLQDLNWYLPNRFIDYGAIRLVDVLEYAQLPKVADHEERCELCENPQPNHYILPFSELHYTYDKNELQSISHSSSFNERQGVAHKSYEVKTFYLSPVCLCEKCYEAIIRNYSKDKPVEDFDDDFRFLL